MSQNVPGAALIVLQNLCHRETFARTTLPFLTADLFDEQSDKTLFGLVSAYFSAYNELPSADAMYIEAGKRGLGDKQFSDVIELIEGVYQTPSNHNYDWVLKLTEDWAKAQKMRLAIRASIDAVDDPRSHGAIGERIREAMAFSFDNKVGHDYLEDAGARYAYYTKKEEKIPLDISKFQEATRGGWGRKTLNLFQAGPNVGKTFVMCHFAAANLLAGYKVLYITLEISEEEIGKRIDANLLSIPIEHLNQASISDTYYRTRVDRLKARTLGGLIIKEYPSGQAGVQHFGRLLQELALKKRFVPDAIYVDYLNICASALIKDAASSYTYVGSVAKELRGFAAQHNVALVSASQFNRDGFKNSDDDMTNTGESFAINFHADAVYSLKQPKELASLGHVRVGHVKSRYMSKDRMPTWLIGLDSDHMRVLDLNQPGDLARDDPDEIERMPFVPDPDDNPLAEFLTQK